MKRSLWKGAMDYENEEAGKRAACMGKGGSSSNCFLVLGICLPEMYVLYKIYKNELLKNGYNVTIFMRI